MAQTTTDETEAGYAMLLGLLEEAVVVFDAGGVIVHANRAARDLLATLHHTLCGLDVKDFFYTEELSRSDAGVLPFDVDGTPRLVMAKTFDGSFVAVTARCLPIAPGGPYMLVANLDADYESSRERTRLLGELKRVNARLSGILSIISSASLGEGTFEGLVERVADELERVMAADAAVFYLTDDYGFIPYGVSQGFGKLGVEKTRLTMGTGVPTLVTRNRRTTRLQLVSPPQAADSGSIMLDLDSEARFRLHSMLAECCSTIIGTPVFSYDRVVAVVIVGWLSPHPVAADDVKLLDTVADFLSVEFAAAVTQMEQKRASGFTAALAEVRERIRQEGDMTPALVGEIAKSVRRMVPSRIMMMENNPYNNTTLVHLCDEEVIERIVTLEYPHGIGEMFSDESGFTVIEPDSACGMWIARHTDLSQGYGVLLTSSGADEQPACSALLVMRGPHDRPFDSQERAFLQSLAKGVRGTLHAEQERVHDAQIARALQVGLRNELPPARGVTAASLYISATESAVVGGDFFDLYELSDGRIVVVMGDVSGKGVEAAAMASLVKTALAAYAWNFMDPASMVSSLNNLFLNSSRLETFASLVVVSVDLFSNRAVYCSAGHPPAMVVHGPAKPAAELELLTVQSPIVGAFENLDYANGTFDFERGDILYLYTDGTTEARDASGAFYGEDALRETLLHACRAGVENVPKNVLHEVEVFASGDLHDDIAMVALRFDGLEPCDAARSSGPNRITGSVQGVCGARSSSGRTLDDALDDAFGHLGE